MRSRPNRRSAAVACALALAALLAAVCGEAGDAPLRVSVIGVDGATWSVIDPLLARGELPNLAALIRSGVRAPLRSERPLISPAIWTTVATGVPRAQHGIRHFEVRNRELVSARGRRVPAVWTLASRAGRPAAVIGWWATYPAESIRGAIISERALKAREEDLHLRFARLGPPALAQLTHPPQVLELLAATLFQLPRRGEGESAEDWLLRRVRVEDEASLRALIGLRERMGPFDLELVLLRGLDPVSHTFWRYHEPDSPVYAPLPPLDPAERARYARAVTDHYRLVDRLLGELPARGAPDRVFVLLSDHGFEARLERSRTGALITGHHRSDAALEGFFVAAGGPVRAGVRLEDAISIYDIAPTLLHLLGLEVADTLSGRVRTDLLEAGWVRAHPVLRTEKYAGPPVDLPARGSPEDADSAVEARLREELRALGYVE